MSTKQVGVAKPAVSINGSEISIDSSRIASSPFVGFANRYALVQRDGFLELVFWEHLSEGRDEPIARAMIPIDATVDSMWRAFEPLLQRMEKLKWTNDEARSVRGTTPVRSAGAAAVTNLVIMTHVGTDGHVDLHHIGPRTVAARGRTPGEEGTNITPAFSVSVPALLIFSFLKDFEARLPALRLHADTQFKR